MIVLFNREGRFAHQLNQFAMLCANALHYDTRFYAFAFRLRYRSVLRLDLPFFEERMARFDRKLLAYLLRFWWMRLAGRQGWKGSDAEFYLRPNRSDELLIGEGLALLDVAAKKDLVTDRILSDVPKLLRYRDTIRSIIQPAPGNGAEALLDRLRGEYDILLGVHVRRGDYRYFAEAAFYFSDRVYRQAIDRFIGLFPGKKVAVVLCSDEALDPAVYGQPGFFSARRPYAEDFFLLCGCDYLIGPHSFFTLMACYLGDNKLYQLIEPEKAFEKEDLWTIEAILEKRYSNWSSILDLRATPGAGG